MGQQQSLLAGTLAYSYGIFLVFDPIEDSPGGAWTDVHEKQGFARRESSVSFATLDQWGTGKLAVHIGPYVASGIHSRVIEVPFHVRSGWVEIKGPEEPPGIRIVKLAAGYYRLTAAQGAMEEEREVIDLFFEQQQPQESSRVILADESL